MLAMNNTNDNDINDLNLLNRSIGQVCSTQLSYDCVQMLFALVAYVLGTY